MSDQGTVNSQIVDSVADVVTLIGGHAPAHAFGMLDAVMVETLGMAMYNAVSRQQGASMIGSAAVTAVCAKMLNAPFSLPPKPLPPQPQPPEPPNVHPLPPVSQPPSVVIAQAAAEAEAAIRTLRTEAQYSCDDAATAKFFLDEISEEASLQFPPPPPPPSPSPPPPLPPSGEAGAP